VLSINKFLLSLNKILTFGESVRILLHYNKSIFLIEFANLMLKEFPILAEFAHGNRFKVCDPARRAAIGGG